MSHNSPVILFFILYALMMLYWFEQEYFICLNSFQLLSLTCDFIKPIDGFYQTDLPYVIHNTLSFLLPIFVHLSAFSLLKEWLNYFCTYFINCLFLSIYPITSFPKLDSTFIEEHDIVGFYVKILDLEKIHHVSMIFNPRI
jgi:hypothetical protein